MNFGKLVKIFHFFIKKIQRPAGLGEIQQGDLNSAVFRGPFPRFSAESAGFRAFPRIRRNPTDSDGFRRILRNPSDSDGMSSKIENFAKFQISTLGGRKIFFSKILQKITPKPWETSATPICAPTLNSRRFSVNLVTSSCSKDFRSALTMTKWFVVNFSKDFLLAMPMPKTVLNHLD